MAGGQEKAYQGVVLGYKLGGGRQYTQIALVKVEGLEKGKAGVVVGGRAVVRDAKGNTYVGRVLRLHGRKNNVVEVRFKPNLPGQAAGLKVAIYPPAKARAA